MLTDQLNEHLRTLITLEPQKEDVLSCYLEIKRGNYDVPFLKERLTSIRSLIAPETQDSYDSACSTISTFLQTGVPSMTDRGVALFSRAGASPFFLGLFFRVPLPNWICASPIAHIYPLVEMKDNYDRYVVLVSTETQVRILEITLGTITRSIFKEMPVLRQRIGREWTKTHYQNHRRERTNLFLKEEIQVLEQLVRSGGHKHLILCGTPKMVARTTSHLPKHLAKLVIDTVSLSGTNADIVSETLKVFSNVEEVESQEIMNVLIDEIKRQGLAVGGIADTYKALRYGQADIVVMGKDFSNADGFVCPICSFVSLDRVHCPKCGHCDMRSTNIKEEIIRMAEESGIHVEVVNQSRPLASYGNIGCLLRYALPEYESVPLMAE